MNPQRWENLSELFFAALDLEPAERPAFLEKACGDNEELRLELEKMLAVEEEGHTLALENRLLSDAPLGPADSQIGKHIGPYLIEKLIGEGGMGEVYLAQRDDDQYQQKVALKLVRPGHRNTELLARFRMERQVLARLVHPNITRLLDGGVDEMGRPYLVMQYIEGVPITTFCDQNNLNIEERLRLFTKVCDAVHYAHQNLVVHRDLKPSNILVTEKGQVKLLDFGIAKLLDPDWEGLSMAITASEIRLMTPEYAAPEQIKGDAITTATDVYALGVLLYELLTGRRPYVLKKRLQAEIERIVCEEEPARPSTVLIETTVGEADTSLESVSRARRMGINRLRRTLQGDLDNVVMMALRKEPDRRYSSVEQFALDIDYYLSEQPILARPSTVRYRFRKYVSRHRRSVAAACLILLALIIGLGMALYQGRIAEQERDRAQLALEQSEEVTAFLMGLFRANNPREARGDTLTARDLLDRGVDRALELQSQPEIHARMLEVIGLSYLSLGEFEASLPLLEQSLETWESLGNQFETARSNRHIAQYWVDMGDMSLADSLHQRALAILDSAETLTPVQSAQVLSATAGFNMAQARYAMADSLYRIVIAIREVELGEDHFLTLRARKSLAMALEKQDLYDESEPIMRDLLARFIALNGEIDVDVLGLKSQLSTLLYKKDAFEEAIDFSEQAVELSRKIYPAGHHEIAEHLVNHAKILITRERRDEAEVYLVEAVAIFKEVYGTAHPDYAWALQNMASNLTRRGELEEASALFEEIVDVHRSSLGNNHPRVATTLLSFGVLKSNQGRYEEAEQLVLEGLQIYKTALGEQNVSVATAYAHLANHALGQDNYDAGIAYADESIAVYRALYPDGHVRTATALNMKGRSLIASNRAAEAIPLLQEGVTIRAEGFSADHWLTAQIRTHLGGAYLLTGDYEKAGEQLRLAFHGFQQADRWQGDMRRALYRLAHLHRQLNRPDSSSYYENIYAERFPDLPAEPALLFK